MEGEEKEVKRPRRANSRLAQSVTGGFGQAGIVPPLSFPLPLPTRCEESTDDRDHGCGRNLRIKTSGGGPMPASSLPSSVATTAAAAAAVAAVATPSTDPMDLVMRCIGDSDEFAVLGRCRLVCRGWRDIADRCGMKRAVRDSVEAVDREAGLLEACAVELSGNMRNSDTQRRIGFLCATTDGLRDMLDVVRTRPVSRMPSSVPLLQVLSRLLRQIRTTRDVVDGVRDGVRSVTVNFDVLELGLRRRVQELASFSDCPTDCIADGRVRAAWGNTFGRYTGAVCWEEFHERFLPLWKGIDDAVAATPETAVAASAVAAAGAESATTEKHLRAFLCFPGGSVTAVGHNGNGNGGNCGDDVVTAYAVHLVCSLYGPSGPRMWADFARLMNRGFIGAVTTVHAENLLRIAMDVLPGDSLVVRYSRQMPELFAITTIRQSSGEVSHYRNVDQRGRPVPIMRFLQRLTRSGWNIAEFYLSEDALTPTARDLARRTEYGIRSPYGITM